MNMEKKINKKIIMKKKKRKKLICFNKGANAVGEENGVARIKKRLMAIQIQM